MEIQRVSKNNVQEESVEHREISYSMLMWGWREIGRLVLSIRCISLD